MFAEARIHWNNTAPPKSFLVSQSYVNPKNRMYSKEAEFFQKGLLVSKAANEVEVTCTNKLHYHRCYYCYKIRSSMGYTSLSICFLLKHM